MSDTTETDKAERMAWAGEYMVPTELARRLERERDEARNQRDILRLDAQREAEHHDRMVGELEKVYKERDEARAAMREAWLAMDEIDGTDRMVKWQNKHANI